jgi:hypothetical protein
MKDCVPKESPDNQILVDGNIFTLYRLQYVVTLFEIGLTSVSGTWSRKSQDPNDIEK